MHIPTTEKLYEHKCHFRDMKLSSFNPESLSYYCNVCGGKLVLKKTPEADEYIKQNESLKFSRQLFLLCTGQSDPEETSQKTNAEPEKTSPAEAEKTPPAEPETIVPKPKKAKAAKPAASAKKTSKKKKKK